MFNFCDFRQRNINEIIIAIPFYCISVPIQKLRIMEIQHNFVINDMRNTKFQTIIICI